MGLEHVVVTSVCRDDLADGGASVFAATIRELRRLCPGTGVEVLIPDYLDGRPARRSWRRRRTSSTTTSRPSSGSRSRSASAPATTARCASSPMPRRWPSSIAGRPGTVHTKSSIMVGLGETREELSQAFRDLRAVDCDILTLGQYLRPDRGAPPRRALRPPRRVRRDEGRGPCPRLQARRIGTPRALLVPRPRPGAGGGSARPRRASLGPRGQRHRHCRQVSFAGRQPGSSGRCARCWPDTRPAIVGSMGAGQVGDGPCIEPPFPSHGTSGHCGRVTDCAAARPDGAILVAGPRPRRIAVGRAHPASRGSEHP